MTSPKITERKKMNTIISVKEAYDTEAFYSYDRSFGYDLTDMLAFTPNEDFKAFMLYNLLWHTYRNFQEPALRFFKIKGRSKLIKIIRNTNLYDFKYAMLFKITEGRLPKDENEIENFLTRNDPNKKWGRAIFYSYNNFNTSIDNMEKIAGLLQDTSIYEWISLYCNDNNNNLNWLIKDISAFCEKLNTIMATDAYGIKEPFNIRVTTHENLLNELIAMGERPAP